MPITMYQLNFTNLMLLPSAVVFLAGVVMAIGRAR